MAKIYTRTGDTGKTSIMGGERVDKDSPRIDAIGSIDELNSVVGVAICFQNDSKIIKILEEIQNTLFTLGSDVATPFNHKMEIPRIESKDVGRLEKLIDELAVGNVTKFILPRGSKSVAFLHLARTVTRRAERNIVTLSKSWTVNPEVLRYINRLSSLFFALAVYAAKKEGLKEEYPKY